MDEPVLQAWHDDIRSPLDSVYAVRAAGVLERRAEAERRVIVAARSAAGGDADAMLRVLSEAVAREVRSPGFRGCPFINASAAHPEPEHLVRVVVDAHRRWLLAAFEELAVSAGIHRSTVAEELMMLRDGAMVSGYLGNADGVGPALLSASRAVIARPLPLGRPHPRENDRARSLPLVRSGAHA
ncbi:hypothetical protein ABIE21_002729 [Conyzicola nivalis]|uniref:TetR family transcriptional regulator n=1 Tax=Conyzicola nivalis TaxID=1477021 RepID=A0ABV2QQI8_9MICO